MKTTFFSIGVVLLLIVTMTASGGGLSVSVTQIPFTAVEELRAPPLQGNWRLDLGAGTGFPQMEEVNDYIQWINRNNQGHVDDIDDYQSYSARLTYGLHPDVHIGIGYEYMEADTDGTVIFMGSPRTFAMDLDAHGVFLFLEKSWLLTRHPLDLRATAEVNSGYYWSSYTETEKGYRASGDDEAIGAEAGLGLSWFFTEYMALTVEGAYRWLKFDDYGVDWVSPGKPAAEVDFTGPVIRVFLSGRF